VIYLDASALVRLVIEHPESEALATWLDERDEEVLVSGILSRVELLRTCRATAPDLVPAALAVLAEVALVPLSSEIADAAWSLPPETLSTDAAIHLASALSLGGDVIALVTYDEEVRPATTTQLKIVSHS
jgi:predicted nucleic acid-binding protein